MEEIGVIFSRNENQAETGRSNFSSMKNRIDRTATFVYIDDELGCSYRLKFFAALAVGRDYYVQLRHVLAALSVNEGAWKFFGRRQEWFATLLVALGIPLTDVFRSRASLCAARSSFFMHPSTSREFELSLQAWIALLIGLSSVKQCRCKLRCRAMLDRFLDMVPLSVQITIPLQYKGQVAVHAVFFDSLKDMRRAPRFLRDFVLYELGFTDIQSLSDLLIRLTAIRLAPYMPTVSAIVQQLSVWVAVAMYRIHTTCDGNPKLLLMPVLRLPCGTKRRLDVGTTLHIFYEKRVGPGVLTLVNEGALDIGRRLGCMCERIVLGAYANKVYNTWRGARRFQVAFDGSDMNGMDWNIFVGSTRSIGLLCVMQPMVQADIKGETPY